MSDAPETIYTNKSGTIIITPPAMPLHETDLAWCRASLPATDAQAMANPKVQALVEAANAALDWDNAPDLWAGDLEDALSALEADK